MTRAELVARLQEAMLENSGAEFLGQVATMIEHAELRISRELSIDHMISHVSGALTAGAWTMPRPSGAVAVRAFRVKDEAGKERDVAYRTVGYMTVYCPSRTTSGFPRFFGNWDGETLMIAPAPDQAYGYTLETEARITGLSDPATTSTWISVEHPDLLFYAAMVEACDLQKNDKMKGQYEADYQRALATAQDEVVRGRGDRNKATGAG